AREVPRAYRRREALPSAVRRPDCQRGEQTDLPEPEPHRLPHPQVPRQPWLPRVRDPDPPAGLWRGKRPAVHLLPHLPRPETLPPDRSRALPEAARGGRIREG